MTRFLIFYFVVYGGAHLYFYFKTVRGISLSHRRKILLGSFLLAIFLAPLAARPLDSAGLETLAELLAICGYLWMGLLFLFITAAAAMDCCNLLLHAVKILVKNRSVPSIPAARLMGMAFTYAMIIGSYGYYETKTIRTEHVSIKSSRIPVTAGRLRIVQMSDVHIGQIVREKRVQSMLAAVVAASPDMLVSTGDLMDGHQRHWNGLDRLFAEINPPLGKYAILGNHEYYAGLEQSVKFMKNAGFRVLINENAAPDGKISITGIDDSRNESQRNANDRIEADLLQQTAGIFRLLLKHRPVMATESACFYDLQLSGHVHKGQIFPFNFFTWLAFPVNTGLTQLQNGNYLYVSRGTGVWGPPIRFLAPPEITVIDLMAAKPVK